MLCNDRDKTVSHIISERRKLATRECKNKHEWLERAIHRELCKKLKFMHTDKCYIHKPEFALEKKTHRILWNYELQIVHSAQDRRPDVVSINNGQCYVS